MATGTVSIGPKRILLWQNSGTSMSSGAEINFSNSDYDDLEVEFRRTGTNSSGVYTQKFPKGADCNLMVLNISVDTASNTFIMLRTLTRSSDTKYIAGAGSIARWGGNAAVSGGSCVPMKIYGIKY